MIFDGKVFAQQRELQLKQRLNQLQLKPKLLSFLIGNDPASLLYTRLKQQAAQRVGIDFQIQHLQTIELQTFQNLIKHQSSQVDGLMVQLPLPSNLKPHTSQILQAIPLDKDVDGLRWQQSGIMPATVKAIFSILEAIQLQSQPNLWQQHFVVVGSQGMVGQPLVHFLRQKSVSLQEIDLDTPQPQQLTRQAEVLISCTGQPHLIQPHWVKPGLISLDVGISKVNGKIAGDFDPQVYQLSSIAVPVPGGVGPVTIVSLLENALQLATLNHQP